MSADLITRLRERRTTRWIHSTGQTPQASGFAVDAECQEAADEIERLRATVQKQALEYLSRDTQAMMLHDELEKLRAAATLARGVLAGIVRHFPQSAYADALHALDAALGEKP